MMSEFLIGHRDPLFGIIMLVLMVGVISLATYFWNLRAQKRRKNSLERFSQAFSHISADYELKAMVTQGESSLETLGMIARAYSIAGDYDRAIKIYLAVLEGIEDSAHKLATLESLGEIYFKAGFLERAKKIFLEVLKNGPRNPHALSFLMQIFEKLGQFEEALEALECLEELEALEDKVMLHRLYLKSKILLNDSLQSLSEQKRHMVQFLHEEPRLARVILAYLKTIDPPLFWEELLRFPRQDEFVDLVWGLPFSEVPLDIIRENKTLLDLYRAKGDWKDDEACERFELETLRVLGRYSPQKGDLDFKYRCHVCKAVFPINFERCPACGELLSESLVMKVRKRQDEAHFSFL